MNYSPSLFDDLCVGTDLATLCMLERHYPQFILIDLTQHVNAIENTSLGFYTDYVELAELACRVYSSIGEFFSIEDELYCAIDEECFVEQVTSTHPTQSSHAKVFFENYKICSAQYVRFIIDTLQKCRVPYFENRGCVYMPDAFICGSWCLKLILRLDD